MEGLEDDNFNTRKIMEDLRLGKYIIENKDYAYSFSGKITDFNAWSEPLDSDYLKGWMNCHEKSMNKTPDLGIKYYLIV